MVGYSATPLARRLGIKEQVSVVVIGAPSKVPTEITEDVVRDVALPMGFVDVKVCAIDETWSALKLVVRNELR